MIHTYERSSINRMCHFRHNLRLTDCRVSIFGRLKYDSAGALGTSIWTNVDVRADDVASRTEQILKILPTSLVRELRSECAQFG